MPPITIEFIVDCADPGALRALCAAPLPPGIHARCVRHTVLRATGPGWLLRAQISVRRGLPAVLVAAWLRARFGGCEAVWYLDGIPVTAGRGPHWLRQRGAGGPLAPPRLATRRA